MVILLALARDGGGLLLLLFSAAKFGCLERC